MSHDQDTSKSRQFLHELAQFYQNRGQLGVTPKHLVARLDGRQVNLWDLYSTVLELGGSFKVNQQSQWDAVYQKLFNRIPVGVNVSVALRQVYQRYLMPYERVNCTNFTTDIAEDDDDSVAARDQPTSFVLHSSLSHPSGSSINVNSLPNANSMLDPMTRLLCALGSGLANEIEFSLKVVTMLTNSRQIDLVADNRFVEALVHCISFGACDCDVDDKCSCVRQFWSSKCKNGVVKSLIYEDDDDIESVNDEDNTGLPLYQQVTDISPEWTHQYSQRVKTVGDLIRRIVEHMKEDSQPAELSEDEIISTEPASLSLVKLTALLILSDDPEFISIGLDIVTSIEFSPKQQEPYKELRRLICLQLASFVVESSDVDVVTRSLDCLSQLTHHSSEAFNKIAKDILTEKLLNRLIQLLTCQHDVHLVVASLEFCLAISQHHPKLLIQSNSFLVKILLNLVNCDAMSHFSEYALKRIKVSDTRARQQPLRTIICQPATNRLVTNQIGQTLAVPGDNESFVVNWLRNCYEAGDSKNCIGINDLYAEYVKYSLKNNRRNVLGVPVFSQLVLKTFPRVSLVNGTRFDGIICKNTSNTMHNKVFTPQIQIQQQQQAQVTSTHGLLTSPILKAHLSAPPKTSPVAATTTASTSTSSSSSSSTSSNSSVTSSSPSTTTSTLIKSLLANKLQSKNSITVNCTSKDSSDDRVDASNATATATALTNAVVTTPILSTSANVASSNSQAVLISTPSVSAAGQPTQQLILVRTVIAPSSNNQGGNIVGMNQGQQVRLILPASAFTQQRPLLQPTVNGTLTNSINLNHLTSQASTLSTVSISQPVVSSSNATSTTTSNDILMKAVLGSGISSENSKDSAKSSPSKSSPLLNVLLDKGKLPPSDSQSVTSQFTIPQQIMNQGQCSQQTKQQPQQQQQPPVTATTIATAATATETPKMFILATKPSAPANQVVNSVVRNGTKEITNDLLPPLTNGDIQSPLPGDKINNNSNLLQINKRSIDTVNAEDASTVSLDNSKDDGEKNKKTKVDISDSEPVKCASNGEVNSSKSIQPKVPKVSDLPVSVSESTLITTCIAMPSSATTLVTVGSKSSNVTTNVSLATNSIVTTATASPTTQAVTVASTTLEFLCEWVGCLKKFTKASMVFKHVYDDHVFGPLSNPMMNCLWGSNDGTGPGCLSKRPRLSLLTHLQDFHCSPNILQQSAIRRQQMGPEVSVASTAAVCPPPPAHPGYAQNAALMAIRRHSVNYVEPIVGPVQNAFTPITVSIRLTAALILRNLADDSSEVRKSLQRHERYLSELCVAHGRDESRTVAQCLSSLQTPCRRSS